MCAPTSPKNKEKQKSQMANNGFLYGTISLAAVVTAGSVTMGHYQSRRNDLGCDALCVGGMTSARSTLTLLGSTIIGRMSDTRALDHIGGARRLFLFLGILALGLDLLLSATATTMPALWVSMIPSALFQQNFNILKALFGEYHDDSASAADRAGSVGKLGMAVGLAFMFGPFLSSVWLTSYVAATLFGGACLLIAALFVWLLPSVESNSKVSPKDGIASKQVATVPKGLLQGFIPGVVRLAHTPPAAVFIACARLCMGLAFHIFQTIWTVALRERFHFGPAEYNQYFGFIGLTFAISQGFLAQWIIEKFAQTDKGRSRVLLSCALTLGGGRMLVYQTHSIFVVYCLFGAIVTALGVINTLFTADTSKIVEPRDLGGLFGLLASVESIAGIAGPVLGGALARIHPIYGPLSAVLSLYGVVFSMVYGGYERIVCQSTPRMMAKKDL